MANVSLPNYRDGLDQGQFLTILSREEALERFQAALFPRAVPSENAASRTRSVVSLKVSDIDSERIVLRIEQGKSPKDRFAMLAPRPLELLRDWYRIAQPAA